MSMYSLSRLPWHLVNWPNSLFLLGTLLLTLTAVPVYLWRHGLELFQVGLFLFFFAATGLSITLGYHRLFSHLTFRAGWPVRLLVVVFGAAAFENSVLNWAADHRQHHKRVDSDDDPYDISKGWFHAHVGWMLFRWPVPTVFDLVKDLQRDPLVRWQYRWYLILAVGAGLVLPTGLGWVWGGWRGALGSLLIAGVARVVFVHHMTFLINSWSHTWGRQTYSCRCTARDNALLAWFSFGEGYHNFHHAFQHDYRNGVRPWQFDPTKWTIWLLHKLGLVSQLRRVPNETILLAEIAEQQRQLSAKLSTQPSRVVEPLRHLLATAQARLDQTSQHWEQLRTAYSRAAETKREAARERRAKLRRECQEAAQHLRAAIRDWHQLYRRVQAQLG